MKDHGSNIIYLSQLSQDEKRLVKDKRKSQKTLIDDPLEELLNEFKSFESNDEEEFEEVYSKKNIEIISKTVLSIKDQIKEQIGLLKEFRERFNYYIDEIEDYKE